VIVQIEPLEEGLVQLPSSIIRCIPIQLDWLAKQAEVGLKHLGTNRKLLPGFLQSLFGTLPINLDAPEACVNLVPRQLGIGCQIQEPLFLDLK
jgi:hypothetical protein